MRDEERVERICRSGVVKSLMPVAVEVAVVNWRRPARD